MNYEKKLALSQFFQLSGFSVKIRLVGKFISNYF